MALGNIDLPFAWQAWQLGDMDVHSAWQARRLFTHWAGRTRLFAWQAWHLATSTFTLRGRREPWRHRPSLCVAGKALGDIEAGVGA